MIEIIPYVIVGAAFVMFVVFYMTRRTTSREYSEPSAPVKIWRWCVRVFDALTGLG